VIDGMENGEIVQIFNVNGQMLKEFQVQSNNHQLTVDELSSGTYFMKMGEQVKKLIIAK
jgi:anaerobic selenocysteine-containing dehydrogenase